MQFNPTDKSISLYADCLSKLGILDTDTTTLPIARFTRSANNWERKVKQWIAQNTGEWEYDDLNYTDLPIATADMVDGQADYTLPDEIDFIERLEVMDDQGYYHKLEQIDQSEITTAMSEIDSTDGLPRYYDVIGNSLILYPTPDTNSVTLVSGLKIYYTRGTSTFSVSDTTKEAGFNEDFHEIISIGAAIDFAMVYDTSKLEGLNAQLAILKDALEKSYGGRNKDSKPKITRKYNRNKRM